MSFDYNTRVRAGIILTIALALLSNVRSFLDWVEFDLGFVGHDDISKFERKFEGVKNKLPPNGAIGYRATAPDDLALYYLTQYTLTPVVVSQLPAQAYVISIDRDALNWSEDRPYRDFVVNTSGSGFKTFDFQNGIKIIKSDSQ